MKINTTFLVFIDCLLLEKSEQTRTNKHYIQDIFKIIQSCITKITFHKWSILLNIIIMYQNKPNLCFICCYINSCSSINIKFEIFIKELQCTCCSLFFISGNFYFSSVPTSYQAYITIPKKKRKTKLTWHKKINYNMSLGRVLICKESIRWAMIKKGRRNGKKERACPHAFFFLERNPDKKPFL